MLLLLLCFLMHCCLYLSIITIVVTSIVTTTIVSVCFGALDLCPSLLHHDWQVDLTRNWHQFGPVRIFRLLSTSALLIDCRKWFTLFTVLSLEPWKCSGDPLKSKLGPIPEWRTVKFWIRSRTPYAKIAQDDQGRNPLSTPWVTDRTGLWSTILSYSFWGPVT